MRTPTHKLIAWKDPARSDELYDLSADPAQEVLSDLRSRLSAWMQRNGDPALSWPDVP